MTTTDQPSAPTAAAEGRPCASCGSPMAADQRYCLSCGARRGEPRVAVAAPEQAAAAPTAATAPPGRPNDVSPLAAVFGIALLGGMLLIGVLIGRGSNNDEAPAPVVQVGDPTAGGTTTTADGGGGASPDAADTVTSEWPQSTDGFTVQLNTLPKPATAAEVELARQAAVDGGAADAAVLDSDLYPSLAPGNYVVYSGVFTTRKDAEAALEGLEEGTPSASVIEVSQSGEAASGSSDPGSSNSPADSAGGSSDSSSSSDSASGSSEGSGSETAGDTGADKPLTPDDTVAPSGTSESADPATPNDTAPSSGTSESADPATPNDTVAPPKTGGSTNRSPEANQ